MIFSTNTIRSFFKVLFKTGFLVFFIFVMELMGIYRGLFGFHIIKIQYAFIFAGIGLLLIVPEYFFSFKDYEKKYGEFNPRRASYWIMSLCAGIFLILLPFFL